jgi:hypothetical protein
MPAPVTSLPLPAVPPLHLGGLHPHEQALVLLVAFGPFVVLAVVVHVLRRRDIAEEERER